MARKLKGPYFSGKKENGTRRLLEKYSVWAAWALLVIAFIGATVWKGNEGASTILTVFVAVGVAILATRLGRWREGGPATDERTTRITNKALALCWWLAIFAVMGVFWLDYLGIFSFQSSESLLTFLTYFMLFSASIIVGYCKKRCPDA